MLPNLPPKKRIENRLSQEVGAVSPPSVSTVDIHSLHQDPVFPAAALSDTDAVSDSSTASNISAESPPPPGTAQQQLIVLL